jgi:hypothetical protein
MSHHIPQTPFPIVPYQRSSLSALNPFSISHLTDSLAAARSKVTAFSHQKTLNPSFRQQQQQQQQQHATWTHGATI